MTLQDDKGLREIIRKAALLNAVQHDGKAQAGPIMGKILGEKQELRTKTKELSALINEVLSEANNLSADEQKRIVEEKWPKALRKTKVEGEKRLPPPPNVD